MDPNKNNQPSSDIPPVPQLSATPPHKPVDMPTPTPPPVSKNGERDPVKDEKYAQSLLHMERMKYEMEQARKPKPKVMSTKKLIYLAIIMGITILSFVIGPLLLKSKTVNTEDSSGSNSNYLQEP